MCQKCIIANEYKHMVCNYNQPSQNNNFSYAKKLYKCGIENAMIFEKMYYFTFYHCIYAFSVCH